MEKKQLVVPVEVYSRVVGYFRPVNRLTGIAEVAGAIA